MSRYRELRQEIIRLLGGQCEACGTDDFLVLDIDHRFSDGAEERRLYKGLAYLEHIRKNIDTGRYAVLCANDNRRKRYSHLETGRRVNFDAITDLDAFLIDATDDA